MPAVGLVLAFCMLVATVGCSHTASAKQTAASSGGSNPTSGSSTQAPAPTSITITGSGSGTELEAGLTEQFAATIQPVSAVQTVTWSVSGIGCSGSACGAIDATSDASGKYTAPTKSSLPAMAVLITANSTAATNLKVGVWISILPAPTGIAVSPSVVTVSAGKKLPFTATGGPLDTIPVVDWSLSGTGCTGPACGTVDASGVYSAPVALPNPAEVTLTATSVEAATVFGSATILLGPNSNNAKLNGHYAFLLRGYAFDNDGLLNPQVFLGTFTADGSGNIMNGVMDGTQASSDQARNLNQLFAGTYTVGDDNRGSITLSNGQSYSFALSSFANGVAGRGALTEIDGKLTYAVGTLAKQDPTSFSPAALNGGFAFGFGGSDNASSAPYFLGGRFNELNGTISAGELDMVAYNQGSGAPAPEADVPFSGTMEINSNGLGTTTLQYGNPNPGFTEFGVAVISASELWFMDIDTTCGSPCHLVSLSGVAYAQSGGPFNVGSLSGTAVMNLAGAAGMAAFNGTGEFAGELDTNVAGTVATNTNLTGSYTVDGDGLGRGVLTMNGEASSFYLVSPGTGFVFNTNGSGRPGMFLLQKGGPDSPVSFSGSYAIGTELWDATVDFAPAAGEMVADGLGGVSGTIDSHDGSADGTGPVFTGNYGVDATGKWTMSTASKAGIANWNLYFISPTTAVAIRVDGAGKVSALRILQQ